MREQACGFLPRAEHADPDAPPLTFGGTSITAECCPAWYYSDPETGPGLSEMFELEAAGVVIDRATPMPIVEAFGVIRTTRRIAEANLTREAVERAENARRRPGEDEAHG